MWCSPDVADGWYYQGPNKRGAQYTFSDVAIQTVLTLGMIYHLPLRQAEGFTDLLVLMGLALRVPKPCRRQADQAVSLSIHLVVADRLRSMEKGRGRCVSTASANGARGASYTVDEATGQIVAHVDHARR